MGHVLRAGDAVNLDEFRERRAHLPRVRCNIDHGLLIAGLRDRGLPEWFLDGLAANYAAEHVDGVEADFRALLDVEATWGED